MLSNLYEQMTNQLYIEVILKKKKKTWKMGFCRFTILKRENIEFSFAFSAFQIKI